MTFESCSRKTIHGVNVFIFLIGLVVMILCSVYLAKFGEGDAEALSKRGIRLGVFLGLLAMATSALGSWAVWKSHRLWLLVYASILMFMFCAFIAVYWILIAYVDTLAKYTDQKSANSLFFDEQMKDVNDFEMGLWNGCCFEKYGNDIPGLQPVLAQCERENAVVKQGWPCVYGKTAIKPGSVTCEFLEHLDVWGAHLVGQPSLSLGCGIYPAAPDALQYYLKENATRDELLWTFQQGLYKWFDEDMTPYVVLALVTGIVMFVCVVMTLCVRTGTDPDEISKDEELRKTVEVEIPAMSTTSPMQAAAEARVASTGADEDEDEGDTLAIEDGRGTALSTF